MADYTELKNILNDCTPKPLEPLPPSSTKEKIGHAAFVEGPPTAVGAAIGFAVGNLPGAAIGAGIGLVGSYVFDAHIQDTRREMEGKPRPPDAACVTDGVQKLVGGPKPLVLTPR
jgi:Glycine zipper